MNSRKTAIILFSFLVFSIGAQNKRQGTFADTLDGAFDMSRFLIEMNGFIPFPFIITEPALGGVGGGLGLVFIRKRPPRIDTVKGKPKLILTQPDIYGVGGLYTANDSWAGLAFCRGTWMKWRTKYRLGTGFANINLSFYRNDLTGKEREYQFNIRTVPLIGSLLRELKGTYWSGGISYTLLRTELKFLTAKTDFVRDKEVLSTVSMPGLVIDFDNRDNLFTPNKGVRARASFDFSNKACGSDYNYNGMNLFAYAYSPLTKNFVGAVRGDIQQVFGDAPFYLMPFINLRGVPMARYQNTIATVVETEFRWDLKRRWSLVGFAGSGKTCETWNEFSGNKWITAGGAGFRYLVARAFKLRAGFDIARGPEQWAYYLVLGNAWLR